MSEREGTGGLKKLEDMYAGFDVVDRTGEKVGSVDTAFIDETNQREYIAVRRGLAGLIPGTGSSLIPMDICKVDNTRETVEVSVDKDMVKDSPSVDTSTTLSSEQASQVRGYYRL